MSDYGNNIRKGVELYRRNHPDVIHTYDITHKIANLLKKTFSQYGKFDHFIEQCHRTFKQVQQTELCFLIPKKKRAKARYANNNEALLGCSDIIESIFSKYKEFSKKSPLREFREMILTIPIFTQPIDHEIVKEAMEKSPLKRVQ